MLDQNSGIFDRGNPDDNDEEDDEVDTRDDADSGHQSDSGNRRPKLRQKVKLAVEDQSESRTRPASEGNGRDEGAAADGDHAAPDWRATTDGIASTDWRATDGEAALDWRATDGAVCREEEVGSSPSTSVSRNEQRDTAYGTDEDDEDESSGTYRCFFRISFSLSVGPLVRFVMAFFLGGGWYFLGPKYRRAGSYEAVAALLNRFFMTP